PSRMRWRSWLKFEETRPPVQPADFACCRQVRLESSRTEHGPRKPTRAQNRPASKRFLGRNAPDVKQMQPPFTVKGVVPGWSAGPDLRCAIAHRGTSRFRVRCFASPRNDGLRPSAADHPDLFWLALQAIGPDFGSNFSVQHLFQPGQGLGY